MALWVTYDNLTAIVGSDAASLLARARGGLDIWVPERLEKAHELARIMGLPAARQLSAAYGGMEIIVPSRRKRESRVREVRDMLARGESAVRIAVKLGVTVRYVRHLAARARVERETAS